MADTLNNAQMSLLYDYYGGLLGERQRDVFNLYYEDNLSLAEIAEDLGISRQGVHEALKKAQASLLSYDEKLELLQKHRQYEETVKIIEMKIDACIADGNSDGKIENQNLQRLTEIKKIIEELDI
ncbi:MAG: helix-turn-helix domain-containing protein [Clostridiales Family XIII bacterium]|jgi:predicted DNA-binding protein YlxM (UPF0122 family)|nr:helix-turn-helix domain-containing protein [Clostridiales Family XIII bacterium]